LNNGYDATFGVDYFPNGDMKLVDAINLNGQPFFFHSVAAYLNSIFLDGYRYSTTEVVNLVRSAGTAYRNSVANQLAAANEAGSCPLGGGPANRYP
jgi:hypothetical protein